MRLLDALAFSELLSYGRELAPEHLTGEVQAWNTGDLSSSLVSAGIVSEQRVYT